VLGRRRLVDSIGEPADADRQDDRFGGKSKKPAAYSVLSLGATT